MTSVIYVVSALNEGKCIFFFLPRQGLAEIEMEELTHMFYIHSASEKLICFKWLFYSFLAVGV